MDRIRCVSDTLGIKQRDWKYLNLLRQKHVGFYIFQDFVYSYTLRPKAFKHDREVL